MSLDESLNESFVPLLWSCSLTALHIPRSKESAKQDVPVPFASKWAPLLWWKMQPVTLLITVAFRSLSVVILRGCSVKAISPARGLMLRLTKTWPLSFPPIGFMEVGKKSQGVWVITFKEKAVIAHPFHTVDLSLAFPQSSKMLYGLRCENGSKVDVVVC